MPARSNLQLLQCDTMAPAIKLLATAVILLFCGVADGAATGKFKKLFVFGDSYVDTGNRDPNNSTATPIGPVNQAWRPPYGMTNPGSPAGHFSDGNLLSEFLGNYMGLSLATYRKYTTSPSTTPTSDGMNFAVGGAGVFDNLGFTKTRDQIAQLKSLIDAGVYDSSTVFDESAILFAISGNDYGAYTRNLPGSDPKVIVTAVVDQMVKDMRTLYNMGFRSFLINEIEPLECLPSATAALGYAACLTPLAAVPLAHNLYLTAQVALKLPFANAIFLDTQYAFYDIIWSATLSGSMLPLKPCCVAQSGALCGDLDSNNNPKYTVCSFSTPSQSPFFWDENHPTQEGWRKVFNLYLTNITFTHARSLPDFLK